MCEKIGELRIFLCFFVNFDLLLKKCVFVVEDGVKLNRFRGSKALWSIARISLYDLMATRTEVC